MIELCINIASQCLTVSSDSLNELNATTYIQKLERFIPMQLYM